MADSVESLTQIEPTEGGEPTGRTVVKVLANRHQLVVGIVTSSWTPRPLVTLEISGEAGAHPRRWYVPSNIGLQVSPSSDVSIRLRRTSGSERS